MKTSLSSMVCLFGLLGASAAVSAGETKTTPPQEPVGFITGAVIGGLAAGPIGAVAGAGFGTWLGNRVHRAGETGKAEARSLPGEEVLDGLQEDVLFRTGSAQITPDIAHRVQVIAQAVVKSPLLKVRVDGYADPRGADELNMRLSQERANAVRDLLLAAGIAENVLVVNAYGKTQSVAADIDGYALERRVRLTLQAPL